LRARVGAREELTLRHGDQLHVEADGGGLLLQRLEDRRTVGVDDRSRAVREHRGEPLAALGARAVVSAPCPARLVEQRIRLLGVVAVAGRGGLAVARRRLADAAVALVGDEPLPDRLDRRLTVEAV